MCARALEGERGREGRDWKEREREGKRGGERGREEKRGEERGNGRDLQNIFPRRLKVSATSFGRPCRTRQNPG